MRRLGLILDQVVYEAKGRHTTDEVFLQFVEACVASEFDEVRFCTRVLRAEESRGPYRVSPSPFTMVALPWYRNIRDLCVRWFPLGLRIRRTLQKEMAQWDACLACGVHPISSLALRMAKRRGLPAALWVRGDVVADVSRRFTGWSRLVGVAIARGTLASVPSGVAVISTGRDDYPFLRRMGPLLVTYSSKFDEGDFRRTLPPRSVPGRNVLYVGRIAPEKGLPVLLAALERMIAANQDHSPKLTIVGSDLQGSSYGGEFRRMVDSFSISGSVRFLGHVPFGEKLFAVYDAHDVLVLPSYTEGFPQVILEAMMRGLPVVSSNVGGVPRLVRHEENGLLVPTGDASALASALSRVLNDGALATRMAKRGLETAAHYTKSNQSRLVGRFLRRLCDTTSQSIQPAE